MAAKEDLTGRQFGRLKVIRPAKPLKYRGKNLSRWYCLCECGAYHIVRGHQIRSGRTKSCGCLAKQVRLTANYRHGLEQHPSYCSWNHMMNRCKYVTNDNYKHYGGRGIQIEDPRWLDVTNFVADMGVRPAGTSLDRIDNEKGYCKENCRWATPKQQARNKRTSAYLTFEGKTQTKADWAEELGVSIDYIKHRIKKGWSLEEIITEDKFPGKRLFSTKYEQGKFMARREVKAKLKPKLNKYSKLIQDIYDYHGGLKKAADKMGVSIQLAANWRDLGKVPLSKVSEMAKKLQVIPEALNYRGFDNLHVCFYSDFANLQEFIRNWCKE